MAHVALCGDIRVDGSEPQEALAACARSRALPEPTFTCFESPLDLIDACMRAAEGQVPPSLVVCATQLRGMNGLQVASELRQSGLFDDGLRMVLCASHANQVIEAARQCVHAYLVDPISQQDFVRAVGPLLASLEAELANSAVLPTRIGQRRVLFSRLTYVETSGRDQLVHRLHETGPLAVRCSSRVLFSYLADDARFYKAGSSYVLNLDFVRSLSLKTGMATLTDGALVPIPVRLRRQFADAICDRADLAV